MERQAVIQEVRSNWKRLYPADKKGKGIVCPLCNSGRGTHGTGITADAAHGKPDSLHCWACGFSGDVLDLIQKDRGLEFNEALHYAAEQLGVTIDSTPARTKGRTYPLPQKAEEQTEDQRDLKEPEALADYSDYYLQAHLALRKSPEALSYLQARGISEKTAQRFLLGYDPAWISPATVKRLEAENNDWRPPKTARIIIPVNESHYVARAISPEVKDYAKMNETGGGRVHIYQPQVLQRTAPVFITEGVFDALSVAEAGATAAALNSTSNIDILLQNLKEEPATVPLVLCLDNDDAGKTAEERLRAGLDKLHATYITADICGEYGDPNEALIKNREAFMQSVKEAEKTAQAEWKKTHKSTMESFLDAVQGEAYRPYETGLSFFDNLLGGGVIRQTILLLLAAPGAGKTTLCQQIAEEMARHGKPVVYLNFEMSREQMIAKAISGRTHRKKNGGKYSALEVLQGYKWTPEQKAEILAEAAEYEREVLQNLQYNPAGISSDLDTVKAYLDRLGEEARQANTEAPVIIVDYLHLIGTTRRMDAQELIKAAIRTLKDYAIKNNTFVIAISATNRTSNSQGRISLESARDSSAIEYTSDYQLSLNYYEVDKGNVQASDPEEMGKLQTQSWRQMILRLNKSRFTMPGRTAEVYFYAKGNTFYSPAEWMPADPERVPFPSAPRSR